MRLSLRTVCPQARPMTDQTLSELARISAAPLDALREANEFAQAGEYGDPLREVMHFARDLVALASDRR
jgi:hypothetical protein